MLLARWSDNAHIGKGLVGLALVASAVPFLVAAALSAGIFRRIVFFFGIFVVWVFARLSALYLVYTVNVIRSMNYGSWVLTSHILALFFWFVAWRLDAGNARFVRRRWQTREDGRGSCQVRSGQRKYLG